MKELARSERAGILRVLRPGDGMEPMEGPYSRDIFLIEVQVAGTSHVVGMDELEPFLQIDERLSLVRVPDNPSDPCAIKIFNRDGLKLGYVPREQNQILARLMDAGKELFAVLSEKSWRGDWLRLRIRIYLHD